MMKKEIHRQKRLPAEACRLFLPHLCPAGDTEVRQEPLSFVQANQNLSKSSRYRESPHTLSPPEVITSGVCLSHTRDL